MSKLILSVLMVFLLKSLTARRCLWVPAQADGHRELPSTRVTLRLPCSREAAALCRRLSIVPRRCPYVLRGRTALYGCISSRIPTSRRGKTSAAQTGPGDVDCAVPGFQFGGSVPASHQTAFRFPPASDPCRCQCQTAGTESSLRAASRLRVPR